jgi:hypothetical protein
LIHPGAGEILQHEIIATSGALPHSGEAAHLATHVSPGDPFGLDISRIKQFCSAKSKRGSKKTVTPQR